MAVTPSKRLMNVSGCTYNTGSSLTITGVKSVKIDFNTMMLSEGADVDFFNTFAAAVGADPKISMTVNQAAGLDAIPGNAQGTLAFTLNDGRNGSVTGGGAVMVTVSNAIFQGPNQSAAHRQLTTADYDWDTYSTDGQTSPIAYAAA